MKIRSLTKTDPQIISAAFTKIGWNKPQEQYKKYLEQQSEGTRAVFVATINGEFVGYLTISWKPSYLPFREEGIPEIQDLNVLPQFRSEELQHCY